MISTKGRYAIRVMIDIAEQKTEDYVPLKDIAERQGISKKYLEAIVKKLVDANLLTGISGKKGGYKLTKSPSNYTIWEILELTEGNMATVSCIENNNVVCDRKDTCKTIPMWVELNDLMKKYLSKRKLSEFV